jgi:RNase P/RNase MRP subunit POP5
VLRASAEALGRLGTDTAAARLVSLSEGDGDRREAVLWGMGTCRRTAVAQALADALHTGPPVVLAKRIVQSLGEVGNAWAWRTLPASARQEEREVRELAAQALLDAYLSFDGEVRQAASNALMVVDFSGTPALIRDAREDRSAAELALLDALAARFAKNPARAR